MTDRTHPDSGRIITSGDVINDLRDTIDRREAVIKLLEQDSADAHARITELEAQLAQRFDAADMATAAAQGFRDGQAPAGSQDAKKIAQGMRAAIAKWGQPVQAEEPVRGWRNGNDPRPMCQVQQAR